MRTSQRSLIWPIRRGLVASAALLAGCGFSGSEGNPADADPDAGPDAAPLDASPDERVDFLAAQAQPSNDVDWRIETNTRIDTSTMTISPPPPAGVVFTEALQDDGVTRIAVLRVRDLQIIPAATLSARGALPLFVLSDGVVLVRGNLDGGGHGAIPGPGGSANGLGLGAGAPSVHVANSSNDSGGGGGSFGTTGAAGGSAGTAMSPAGARYAIDTRLMGGASGGGGGACTNLPGAGGGALLIYARRQLRVDGAINVGGGGGAGGLVECTTNSGGGAGGGSGGALWIQTPELGGLGVLSANGGGGGGGAYPTNGGAGQDGKPSSTAFANGGINTGNIISRAGGDGAVAGRPAPAVSPVAGNGGGGGGGLGRIVYRAPGLGSLKSSPVAVVAP